MEDRHILKDKEVAYLKQVNLEHPELFEKRDSIDNAAVLESVGITLPNKDNLPLGFVKLWPQDFIVEEISPSGEIYTIERKNLLSDGISSINPEHQTIYATLVKCGVSTLEAIDEMARIAGCNQNQITYAGIKDKDAITAQRISFRNVPFEQIQTIVSPHFFLKDVESGKGVMAKGMLHGNRFSILVRTEPTFQNSDQFASFIANLTRVKQQGFYNFYYLQRFGVPRNSSFRWGISILKGDYKKAVYEFFTVTTSRELGFVKNTRAQLAEHFGAWNTILSILEPMPLIFEIETKMARHLKENPEDYIGALKQVPDQTMLWIYGISSYLFNRQLSRYSATFAVPPKKLSLFLNRNIQDWMPYKSDLAALGIMPPPFENLRHFPHIKLMHRDVDTMEQVTFSNANILDEGIKLQFSLSKGSYATTLLSHLFTIVGQFPINTIAHNQISPDDIHATTIEYFAPIIRSKLQEEESTSTEE